ncbi:P-loop containing nucleoside triphosphate hydrolase protein, partial [Thamnocephalis sphaerospora]
MECGSFDGENVNAFGIGADDSEALAEVNKHIKVFVRVRPMNQLEIAANQYEIATVGQRPTAAQPYGRLFLHEPQVRMDWSNQRTRIGVKTRTFRYDDVFDASCDNDHVYDTAVKPLMQAMEQDGARVTLFAHGQSGSGKTHTVFGSAVGIHQRIMHDLFALVEQMRSRVYLVPYLSFFEIHQDKFHDLLQSRALCDLHSDDYNTKLKGLKKVQLNSPEEAMELIRKGNLDRTVGATSLNAAASRSHAIVQVTLCKEAHGQAKRSVYARFNLVDLAGSDCGAGIKEATIKARAEGGGINKSLLELKNRIRELSRMDAIKLPASGKESFRSAKLTRVLRDSLVSPLAYTSVIACVSPASGSLENTIGTLRY